MESKNFNRRNFVKKVAGLAGLASVAASTVAAVEPFSPPPPAGNILGTSEGTGGPVASKDPVVHFEIGCRDLAATKDFYQKMFDWPIDEHYQIAEAGLPGHLVSLGHEPQHYTTFYVQVDDVAAAIAKAESLGGKKVVGPITIPTGTFAWINDTQQNMIGVWKPKIEPVTN